MDWTIKDAARGEPQSRGRRERPAGQGARCSIDATVGAPVTLDAAGTRDPDGHALTYSLVLLSRSGHRHPRPAGVRAAASCRSAAAATPGEGGIPSAPAGGPREPPARVTLQDATTPRVTVTPRVAGTAHIILAVEDDGTPTLTSYRRVILTIK